MCVQCVANSVPYVGLAVGGLRLMSWNARQSTRKLAIARRSDPDHDRAEPLGRAEPRA
jgi:hypothetical protein